MTSAIQVEHTKSRRSPPAETLDQKCRSALERPFKCVHICIRDNAHDGVHRCECGREWKCVHGCECGREWK
jgi:hypothetical protein